MYKHVLVATDGSELGNKALAHGVSLAKALGAKVTAMTVTEPYHLIASDPQFVTDNADTYREETLARARQTLDAASEICARHDIACHAVMTEDDHPWEAILATAAQRECDLIVMASHGRGPISGLILGSQTQKVLSHSDIPVLVCR